jgi:hypothetical protein
MAVPSTNVGLSSIQTEFGGSNPISISEYYAGGSFVPGGTSGPFGSIPSSGQISFGVFRGTVKVIPLDFLVIAGGGGGGRNNYGGGGGSGGYRTSSQSIGSGTVVTVSVGTGGAAGTGTSAGTNGGTSSISGTGVTTITSAGGWWRRWWTRPRK